MKRYVDDQGIFDKPTYFYCPNLISILLLIEFEKSSSFGYIVDARGIGFVTVYLAFNYLLLQVVPIELCDPLTPDRFAYRLCLLQMMQCKRFSKIPQFQ